MKFTLGLKKHQKRAKLKKWHRWFAWKPVKAAPYDYRWLETVHRRLNIQDSVKGTFEYKPFDKGQR